MKAKIHYVKGNSLSESMATESLASYKRYHWDAELVEGYTPATLPAITEYMLLPNGRLHNLKDIKVYLTKLSIAMNQIRFWKEVVDVDEPMAFVEHDSIACAPYTHYNFNDILFFNMDDSTITHQMKNIFCRPEHFDYKLPKIKNHTNKLPNDWPWIYQYENVYENSKLPPGTSGYVLKPDGAKKLLDAVEKYGIEQGDMMINSHNIDIVYSKYKMCTYHKNSNKLKSLDKDYHG